MLSIRSSSRASRRRSIQVIGYHSEHAKAATKANIARSDSRKRGRPGNFMLVPRLLGEAGAGHWELIYHDRRGATPPLRNSVDIHRITWHKGLRGSNHTTLPCRAFSVLFFSPQSRQWRLPRLRGCRRQCLIRKTGTTTRSSMGRRTSVTLAHH